MHLNSLHNKYHTSYYIIHSHTHNIHYISIINSSSNLEIPMNLNNHRIHHRRYKRKNDKTQYSHSHSPESKSNRMNHNQRLRDNSHNYQRNQQFRQQNTGKYIPAHMNGHHSRNKQRFNRTQHSSLLQSPFDIRCNGTHGEYTSYSVTPSPPRTDSNILKPYLLQRQSSVMMNNARALTPNSVHTRLNTLLSPTGLHTFSRFRQNPTDSPSSRTSTPSSTSSLHSFQTSVPPPPPNINYPTLNHSHSALYYATQLQHQSPAFMSPSASMNSGYASSISTPSETHSHHAIHAFGFNQLNSFPSTLPCKSAPPPPTFTSSAVYLPNIGGGGVQLRQYLPCNHTQPILISPQQNQVLIHNQMQQIQQQYLQPPTLKQSNHLVLKITPPPMDDDCKQIIVDKKTYVWSNIQRKMGDTLHAKLKKQYPKRVGKIVGMILRDCKIFEIEELLENGLKLKSKIDEFNEIIDQTYVGMKSKKKRMSAGDEKEQQKSQLRSSSASLTLIS